MCVLSIKVPIRKKSGNLFNDPRIWPPTLHLKDHPSKTCRTLLEKQVTFFYGPLPTNVLVLADQQELINISSVRTQDVVWNPFRERWIIATDGERESGISALSV